MSSIITSLNDLLSSIVEVILSVFGTGFNVVEGTIKTAINFVLSIVDMCLDVVKGTLNTAGGLGQFVASNIVVIGVLALAVFGFLQYQRRQGNTVQVGNKKLN